MLEDKEVWLLHASAVIPDNERLLHQAKKTATDLKAALSWA